MTKGILFMYIFKPLLGFSLYNPDVDKETLVRIILILLVLLAILIAYEIRRTFRNRSRGNLFRIFRKIRLQITLDKDRNFRPQVLTLTIRNTGKREAKIEAPVLEYSKIWSKRKFKLNGVNGNQIYPMFIDPGKMHLLRIETATFHQYDRSIKSYYWARIKVRDVDGRKWRSNAVKLRKSLVT